jgi:hypothetical protein
MLRIWFGEMKKAIRSRVFIVLLIGFLGGYSIGFSGGYLSMPNAMEFQVENVIFGDPTAIFEKGKYIGKQEMIVNDFNVTDYDKGKLRKEVAEHDSNSTVVPTRRNVTNPSSTSLIYWWKDYVDSLARVWLPRLSTSWCLPEVNHPTNFSLAPEEEAEGMIYVKSYKASSSTCEGIALNIAHHVARRRYGDNLKPFWVNFTKPIENHPRSFPQPKCIAHTRHKFSDNVDHARRAPGSLLWSFIRHPRNRDLSHIFHMKIGRDKTIAQNDSQAIIDFMETRLKGWQTRYLVPQLKGWREKEWGNPNIAHRDLWPRWLLRTDPEQLMPYLKQMLIGQYDFLGVTERMEESLAVMVLLWGLEPSDVIVLSSKRSGGWDDGGGGDGMCVRIPKVVTTPTIAEYLRTKHSNQNVDYLLFYVINKSLDLTIESLGVKKVQNMAAYIRELSKVAEENCRSEAWFPCDPEGNFQPEPAYWNCYVQDAGCGFECIDRVLQKYTLTGKNKKIKRKS